MIKSLEKTLKIVNTKLDAHERLHNIVVVNEEWNIENKLLTPTMKIKRNSIEKKYKEHYSIWYHSSNKIVT